LAATHAPARPPARTFPPGSDWLYAKLYTGTGTADRVLLDLVEPLVCESLQRDWADGWFYLRYGDPDWHLRLRFHGEPPSLLGELLPALHQRAAAALASGLIWKLQLDTYEREVERYGGPLGIELAERLFQVDCEASLEMLGLFPDDEHADVRWRLTLKGLDLLLDDLGFKLAAKLEIAAQARQAYAAEFKQDLTLQRQLGERFRTERRALEALLDDTLAADDPLQPGLRALSRRSERLQPIAAALREAARQGQLTAPLAQLAPSYLHVHAFRLLRADQRRHELVLYEFLTRLYESRRARAGP
jgi:thiopeptide-type bacteriocin biosynthesis protein